MPAKTPPRRAANNKRLRIAISSCQKSKAGRLHRCWPPPCRYCIDQYIQQSCGFCLAVDMINLQRLRTRHLLDRLQERNGIDVRDQGPIVARGGKTISRAGLFRHGSKQLASEAQAPWSSMYHFFPQGKEQLAEQ